VIRDGGTATINSIKLPVNANKEYTVKIVQEGSAAAIYVNDAVALSIRCYKMNQNPWGIFANGTANFTF